VSPFLSKIENFKIRFLDAQHRPRYTQQIPKPCRLGCRSLAHTHKHKHCRSLAHIHKHKHIIYFIHTYMYTMSGVEGGRAADDDDAAGWRRTTRLVLYGVRERK
jgi:hypothetical protein